MEDGTKAFKGTFFSLLFEQGALPFHFTLEPTNNVARPSES